MIYEVIVNDITGSTIIKRTDEDGSVWWFPEDESNSDYQRYLNPQAALSTPNV